MGVAEIMREVRKLARKQFSNEVLPHLVLQKSHRGFAPALIQAVIKGGLSLWGIMVAAYGKGGLPCWFTMEKADNSIGVSERAVNRN